jgi:hypothetical protein
VEYITKVNSKYRANEFTSSQLAKTAMTMAQIGKTGFPIVHRIVKDVLRTWEEEGLCTHVSLTKYSRCRKTKDTYRFNLKGLKEIKKKAIEETIETIERNEIRATPIMKTRESLIKDKLEELLDSMAAALLKEETDV